MTTCGSFSGRTRSSCLACHRTILDPALGEPGAWRTVEPGASRIARRAERLNQAWLRVEEERRLLAQKAKTSGFNAPTVLSPKPQTRPDPQCSTVGPLAAEAISPQSPRHSPGTFRTASPFLKRAQCCMEGSVVVFARPHAGPPAAAPMGGVGGDEQGWRRQVASIWTALCPDFILPTLPQLSSLSQEPFPFGAPMSYRQALASLRWAVQTL